jgi:peptidyl-dipeptidase Dcp
MLQAGDSVDQAELYRRFRGRDPEVSALLGQRGFPVAPGGKPGAGRN